MSDVISLLPDSVANQIAAGEVIQRPASVIKELVENAVDAGAKTIHVIVLDAGRTSIQVIDDGTGMSETDARLAFERHATSKIRKADDLFALHTMGFRGEALASIAAVAQVELQTRTEQDEIGTLISLAGSKVLSQEPVSCPVGSNFKVENLFFNVPARRKFLKTNATELNNILTAFERIVLVYPEICFTLHNNGVELMNLRAGSLRQRITDVFGRQYGQDLIPVEVNTALCRIYGFVTKPESARKKGGCDYLFVNGRYMKHPYFHKAVITAYDRLIPEGMLIPYFLYFDINPADIDVNIHPTKTEIKFENEQAIWQILMAAVRDAIGKFCEVPTIDFDTVGRPEIPVYNPDQPVAPPEPHYNPDYNPFEVKRKTEGGQWKADSGKWKGSVDSQWQTLYDNLVPPTSTPDSTDLFEMNTSTVPEMIAEKSPVHYQFKGKYIMTAVKSGLMIIDQHRADIRILYEKYVEQQRAMTSNTQKMLFPETIQFSASDAVMFESILPMLSGLGFDLSDLGGNTYAINGIPAGIEGIDPVMLLQRMVSDALEKGRGVTDEINSTVALSLARSAAIPYGQILNNEEMENLINELFACSNANYTPDGKAILCILPQSDIEHLLG
ncbi:MAG: DNA mismatch repair endonuclease MutL [Prevotella sp.]|nr:DNA mismatch repair endonuclease MutL [Prevotella sp.]